MKKFMTAILGAFFLIASVSSSNAGALTPEEINEYKVFLRQNTPHSAQHVTVMICHELMNRGGLPVNIAPDCALAYQVTYLYFFKKMKVKQFENLSFEGRSIAHRTAGKRYRKWLKEHKRPITIIEKLFADASFKVLFRLNTKGLKGIKLSQ